MLYPLKFKPNLKQFIWGGEKIAPYKGITSDQDHIGESWEVSAYKGLESVVASGALEGKTLPELVREYKGALVGEHVYERFSDEFPILIKFIDALNDLSIQVHPNDALAEKRHSCRGKTEMWYVVDAEPGAKILSGLSKEITPEEYETLVKEDRIVEVLSSHEAHKGDVFFLPAGRIHAICKGCFVAEIQETSDITYRIYDYGRLGLDGKPRELHTEEAKEAIDYKVYPSYRTEYVDKKNAEVVLAECEYFTTSLYTLDRPYFKDLKDIDSFIAVICVEGDGTLETGIPTAADGPTKGHLTEIRRGDSVLIPATALGVKFKPGDNGLKLITSYIG